MSSEVRDMNAFRQSDFAYDLFEDGRKRPLGSDEQGLFFPLMEYYKEMTYFGGRGTFDGLQTLDKSAWRRSESCDDDDFYHTICPLSQMKNWPDNPSLGDVGRLDDDVMNRIVSNLDLSTLYSFMAVSRRAYGIVHKHPQVKILFEHTSMIIHGFFAVKLAATITVDELFASLQEKHCVECGDFGGYMYMFTHERVCSWCVERVDRFSVVREVDAMRKFGLGLEILALIPHMESFPPTDTGHGPREGLYLPLYDRASISRAASELYGPNGSATVPESDLQLWKAVIIKLYKDRIEGREIAHDKARLRKQRADELRRMTRSLERKAAENRRKREAARAAGVECTISDDDDTTAEELVDLWFSPSSEATRLKNAKRNREALEKYRETRRHIKGLQVDMGSRFGAEERCLIAVLRVPWLNMELEEVEWGFHCYACLKIWAKPAADRGDKAKYFLRDFIATTFEEHMDEFDSDRTGKHLAEGCLSDGLCHTRADPARHCETCSDKFRDTIHHRIFWRG
ncbi:hypothetical protein E4U42_005262 [Claviceps africana]|uniref:F-box domain-containing protein n=1 Tax=Claviceps africana TaxID=83212 RepID=A0A8K0J430_9HYPO|nr:hypothetical protein E4U42_005262 [Claviceps africana]